MLYLDWDIFKMLFRIGQGIYKISRSLFEKAKKSGQLTKKATEIKNPSQQQKNQALRYSSKDKRTQAERNRKALEDLENAKERGRKVSDELNQSLGFPKTRKALEDLDRATERLRKATAQMKADRLKREAARKPKGKTPDENIKEQAAKNIQAEDLTKDPTLTKMFKSGKRKMKVGGQIGRPKGVGKALRGYGRAMK
jgi:hypothetical protein